MKRFQVIALFLALFLFILISVSDNAGAASMAAGPKTVAGTEKAPGVHNLKPGDDLQAAFDSLESGGSIILSEGTYPVDGSIRIRDKGQILIEGEGRVSVVGSRIDFPIFIFDNCSNVTLRNIHAVHKNDAPGRSGFDKPDGSVVYLESCSNMIFNGCELEGCGVYGIYSVNTDVIDVIGCYLHHNSWRAIGIASQNSKTLLTIKDSNISQNTGFMESSEESCTLNLEGGNFISDNTPEAYKNGR